jgi:hypothetical protein
MHLVMPWFLPLAAVVAYAGTRLAREQRRGEAGKIGETLFLLYLTWSPLLYWLLAQFTSPDPRQP